MSSRKHEISPEQIEKGYEANIIGLKGIIGFGLGIFFLIVITFALMYLLEGQFAENEKASRGPENPMAMSDKERLPPEPRLQDAPGFGVDGPKGRINLELKAPQDEHRELEKQWKDLWANGMKDPATGAVSAMPIEKAKEILLSEHVKAKSGPDADKLFSDSKLRFADASSGRVATDRRR